MTPELQLSVHGLFWGQWEQWTLTVRGSGQSWVGMASLGRTLRTLNIISRTLNLIYKDTQSNFALVGDRLDQICIFRRQP